MKALIVEDEAELRGYIGTILASYGYEPVLCSNAESALEYCHDEFFPLIILDINLPGMDGLELCRRLRKTKNGDDYYILVNSVRGDQQNIIDLLNSGADDYCVKPVDLQRAQIRLMVAERHIRIRQERRDIEAKMHYMAYHDSLTSLGNRHAFYEFLEHALAHSRRYHRKGSVLYIDLDGFKDINDRLGHNAGDSVLREAGRRLQNTVRNTDKVCRMGGDEFAIVVTELDDEGDIASVQEKIGEMLAKPYFVNGASCYLGGSVGVVTFPDDGTEPDELVHRADQMMYAMKKSRDSRLEATHVAQSRKIPPGRSPDRLV